MAIADTFDSDYPYRPYSIPGMNDAYTSLPPMGDDTQWGKKDWLEYVVKKQLEEGYDFRFEDAITRDYMRYLDYADALEAGDMEAADAIASMFEARQFDGELQEPNFTYERNEDGKLEAIPIPGANEDKPLFQDIWDWTTDSIGDAGNWIFDEQGARVDVPWAASKVGDYITDTEWDKVIPNAIAQSPEMLGDMLFTYPQLFYQSGKDALTLAGIGNDELNFEDYFGIFHNKPKVAFYDEENQGADSAETLTEEAIAMGIAPLLYRYIHNRLPTKWASRLAKWAPAVHYMSGLGNTDKSKNFIKNFAKNTFGGWGSSLKGAWKGAALGWPAAALSTLFYSPPLGAEEEYEGVYAKKPKFDFTYNPNANINTALIQDSDPVVFDPYMQEKLANFEPRTTAPGPRNNYQGL